MLREPQLSLRPFDLIAEIISRLQSTRSQHEHEGTRIIALIYVLLSPMTIQTVVYPHPSMDTAQKHKNHRCS